MVSILLQRRNIIKCIFTQQLPAPALQIPAPPPVFLHLIGEECAGVPQVGLKNAEFPYSFRRSQMTLVSYILSLLDHCYSFIKQRNGKVRDWTTSFFHDFCSMDRKHAEGRCQCHSPLRPSDPGIPHHPKRGTEILRGFAQARN